MAKKEKSNLVKKNIDKISTLVAKEIQKAADQVQDFLVDLSRQTDDLQKQIREPVRKVLKDLEEFRDKELKKIQDEYQRVVTDLTSLQEQLSEKLGVQLPPLKKSAAESKAEKQPTIEPQPTVASKAVMKEAVKKKPTAKPKAASKPATSPKAATGKSAAKATAKSSTTKAATTKTATAKTSAQAGDDLTKLTGVGPALSKKLKEAGITSYQQIAQPTEQDKQALAQIGKVKHSDKWAEEAKALVAQK